MLDKFLPESSTRAGDEEDFRRHFDFEFMICCVEQSYNNLILPESLELFCFH